MVGRAQVQPARSCDHGGRFNCERVHRRLAMDNRGVASGGAAIPANTTDDFLDDSRIRYVSQTWSVAIAVERTATVLLFGAVSEWYAMAMDCTIPRDLHGNVDRHSAADGFAVAVPVTVVGNETRARRPVHAWAQDPGWPFLRCKYRLRGVRAILPVIMSMHLMPHNTGARSTLANTQRVLLSGTYRVESIIANNSSQRRNLTGCPVDLLCDQSLAATGRDIFCRQD